jgi:hypothetical protein
MADEPGNRSLLLEPLTAGRLHRQIDGVDGIDTVEKCPDVMSAVLLAVGDDVEAGRHLIGHAQTAGIRLSFGEVGVDFPRRLQDATDRQPRGLGQASDNRRADRSADSRRRHFSLSACIADAQLPAPSGRKTCSPGTVAIWR